MSKGLTEMPKVGDKVRYIGKDYSYLTNGNIYDITSIDEDGDAVYVDDEGDDDYIEMAHFEDYKLVTEQSLDVTDLIANLGRRVHEIEGADAINSPQHYKRGKFETIEVIEEITAGYSDGFVAHCAGTAIKYIARAPYKHETPLEDLRKSAKYLEFAIKRLESKGAS